MSFNMSQEQMAEKLGVSINYISLIENGKKNPGNAFLRDFSKKFNVPNVLLVKQNLIPEPKNEKEKELFDRFHKLVDDFEILFLKSDKQR